MRPLFARNPQGSGRYAGRLLGRAFCQGAALHYVNMQNGVEDVVSDMRQSWHGYDRTDSGATTCGVRHQRTPS